MAIALQAVGSRAKYLDAVGVMIAFNFVTRVANALGVEPEISPWIRRIDWLRQAVFKGMSLLLRGLVDLRRRNTTLRTSHENLLALRGLFDAARLGPEPGYLHRLNEAPQLLESQSELLEALLMRGTPAGPIQLSPELFRSVGLVVLHEIRSPNLHDQLIEAIRQYDRTPPERVLELTEEKHAPGRPEAVILRFARDVTRWSYRITRERIDELRACHLTDADILDLVSATAFWNASGRLEILVTGLPDGEPTPGCGEEQNLATVLPS